MAKSKKNQLLKFNQKPLTRSLLVTWKLTITVCQSIHVLITYYIKARMPLTYSTQQHCNKHLRCDITTSRQQCSAGTKWKRVMSSSGKSGRNVQKLCGGENVRMPMHDYKSLCVVVMICCIPMNTQTAMTGYTIA